MVDPTTTNNCAAGPQCVMPTAPVAKTHCCPGCGKDVHGICGESHGEAQLLYSTTCFQCVRIHGRALKGPNDYQNLPEAPPAAAAAGRGSGQRGGRGRGGRGHGRTGRGQGAAGGNERRNTPFGGRPGGRGGRAGAGRGRSDGRGRVGGRGRGAVGNRSVPILQLTHVIKKTKATGTFKNLDGENLRVVLYFYWNQRTLLTDELLQQLDQNLEPLLLEELRGNLDDPVLSAAKADAIQNLSKKETDKVLRPTVKEFLSRPPGQCPIKLQDITSQAFGTYLCSCRGNHGHALEGQSYGNKVSSLGYLFKRNRVQMPAHLEEELSEILKGLKRTVSERKQAGEGNVEHGKREMTFELYEKFMLWFMQEGTRECSFARAFLGVCWNLLARGDSSQRVGHKHLIWRSDACGIPFAHGKSNQNADSRKRQPRHVYCNPVNALTDCILAIFEYMCCFPEIIRNSDGPLFPGSDDSQAKRHSGHGHTIT